MKSEIEKLIPHRFPFLFVDEIITANEKEVVGFNTFDERIKGGFYEFDFIPGMIIIESMAQCGGAGVKKAGLASGLFGLVSMENIKFLKEVTFNEEIKYVIQNIRVSNRIIKQTGIAYNTQNDPIAEASWMCARIDKF